MITGYSRNIIYYTILIIGFLGIVIVGFQTADQNAGIEADYQTYANALQRNPAEAEKLLQPLVKKYADSSEINMLYGASLGEQKKYAASLQYLDTARKIRPALVGDQKYLAYYGHILLQLGRQEDAKVFLTAAVNSKSANPQVTKSANDELNKIH